MPESEPQADASFVIAWNLNRFEALALDPEALARVIADAEERLHDESLEDVHRVAYGLVRFALRNLQLGATPAEVHQQVSESLAMLAAASGTEASPTYPRRQPLP